MKKFLAALLASMMIFAFAACGSSDDEDAASASDVTSDGTLVEDDGPRYTSDGELIEEEELPASDDTLTEE